MCQDRHIKDIMGFQHDWNREVIAQFYATVYFEHDPENGNERTIYWMTDQVRFMYPKDRVGNAGKVTGLYTYYSILNRLFRKTPTPRNGNPSDISSFAKNLM